MHQPARMFREALEELHTLDGVTYLDAAPRRGLVLSRARPLYRTRAAGEPPARPAFRRAPHRERPRAAQIFRLAGAAEILHGVRALLQSATRPRSSRNASRNSCCSMRSFPIRCTSPSIGCAMRWRMWRRARRRSAARRASVWPDGSKATVDFGQIDELMAARSARSSPTSRGNANRSTKPSMPPTSPMARRRCCDQFPLPPGERVRERGYQVGRSRKMAAMRRRVRLLSKPRC